MAWSKTLEQLSPIHTAQIMSAIHRLDPVIQPLNAQIDTTLLFIDGLKLDQPENTIHQLINQALQNTSSTLENTDLSTLTNQPRHRLHTTKTSYGLLVKIKPNRFTLQPGKNINHYPIHQDLIPTHDPTNFRLKFHRTAIPGNPINITGLDTDYLYDIAFVRGILYGPLGKSWSLLETSNYISNKLTDIAAENTIIIPRRIQHYTPAQDYSRNPDETILVIYVKLDIAKSQPNTERDKMIDQFYKQLRLPNTDSIVPFTTNNHFRGQIYRTLDHLEKQRKPGAHILTDYSVTAFKFISPQISNEQFVQALLIDNPTRLHFLCAHIHHVLRSPGIERTSGKKQPDYVYILWNPLLDSKPEFEIGQMTDSCAYSKRFQIISESISYIADVLKFLDNHHHYNTKYKKVLDPTGHIQSQLDQHTTTLQVHDDKLLSISNTVSQHTPLITEIRKTLDNYSERLQHLETTSQQDRTSNKDLIGSLDHRTTMLETSMTTTSKTVSEHSTSIQDVKAVQAQYLTYQTNLTAQLSTLTMNVNRLFETDHQPVNTPKVLGKSVYKQPHEAYMNVDEDPPSTPLPKAGQKHPLNTPHSIDSPAHIIQKVHTPQNVRDHADAPAPESVPWPPLAPVFTHGKKK